jgi:hypothetical protein
VEEASKSSSRPEKAKKYNTGDFEAAFTEL